MEFHHDSIPYCASFRKSAPSFAKPKDGETINFVLPTVPVEKDLLGKLGHSSSYPRYQCVDADRVDCSLRLGLPQLLPPAAVEAAATRQQARERFNGDLVHLGPQLPQSSSLFRPAELCSMCSATETPLWRRGPNGPRSLCNACGIRYKKEERRLALSLGNPNQS